MVRRCLFNKILDLADLPEVNSHPDPPKKIPAAARRGEKGVKAGGARWYSKPAGFKFAADSKKEAVPGSEKLH